jgi:hypothetical protein
MWSTIAYPRIARLRKNRQNQQVKCPLQIILGHVHTETSLLGASTSF